jgi:nicotinate-nucleotide pyrophosphorylase (carboxylating)
MQDKLEDWFAEDYGKGDFTSQAVVENKLCKASVTGGPGIISGLEICRVLLENHNINFKTDYKDGDEISSSLILSLKGNAHDVLAIERLLLNLLSHLSGIATHTSKVVRLARKVNSEVEILATRKTLPGLRDFEKAAVVHGGGQTHRMRLDDAILIKDNHLKLSGSIENSIKLSREKYPRLMLEVEADNEEQAIRIANCGADRVMLDNFTPKEAVKTIKKLRKISNIEIEISGGVTMGNIAKYAEFADYISLGSLTMSLEPVDFSLHVI